MTETTNIYLREYHLVVTNARGETLYHRNITEDEARPLDLSHLEVEIYLDEVEQHTGLKLSPEIPYSDTGEIKVTIGFSSTPQEDLLIWNSKEFYIEIPEVEKSAFDQWLAENYTPAGEDASNGEQWYLSNSPHEFLPISLSKLREQYNLDNDEETQEDELDNVTTFQIPEHYLSLIFNDDASGYGDEEIEAWEEFEQQMIASGFTNGHWSYPDNQESYFSHTNDVTNLGDNVVDLQWVENNEK